MWWQLMVGIAASIVILTNAARGLVAVVGHIRDGTLSFWMWVDERRRTAQAIDDLTSPDGWPNGASSLKESHQDLYRRLRSIEARLDEIGTHLGP